MTWSASLVDENAKGEQIVRGPRRTDAIAASLREAFATGAGVPADMLATLRRLDRAPRPYC